MKKLLSMFPCRSIPTEGRAKMRYYYMPLWARGLASFLAFAQIFLTMPSSAYAVEWPSPAALIHALINSGMVSQITVNRTTPPPFKPNLTVQFSSNPTADEISRLTLFPERLIPVGVTPTETENAALAQAILAYAKKGNRKEDVGPLVAFLQEYPQSSWNLSLDVNLGIIYRQSGYYSKALDAWRQAWALAKDSTDPNAQLLGGRAFGELVVLLSSLGRSEELKPLLDSVKDRPLYGSSLQQVISARQGLWLMNNKPGDSFKCGPYALGRILAFEKPGSIPDPLIAAAQSSTKGFSLDQVEALSNKLKMNLQMAKRSVGAPILFPAVLHWKVGHYAAILKESHGKYLIQDPTFGDEVYISADALDAEASGYFLVPNGPLPKGWQSVDDTEAKTVWGRGLVTQRDPNATGPGDPKCKNCPKTAGMARYNVFAMLVSLNIQDTPVGYTPPVGPAVPFVVTFNQLEANQPGTFNYSNLGPLAVHNWMSYVVTPTTIGQTTYINVRGGGRETYLSTTYISTGSYPGYQGYFSADTKNEATLWVTTSGNYERRLPDGAKEVFSTPNGAGNIFLNQVVDPQGNAVTLTYDGSYRLTAITDAIGQVTTLSYGFSSDTLKITKVTDPFGRFATFSYSSTAPYKLVSVTDEIGITSQLTYGSGNILTALTTPYGQTTFNQSFAASVTSLEIVDPLGAKEFYMSRIDGVGIPSTETNIPSGYGLSLTNNYLQYRDTYFWDKKAVMDYGESDYTKAQIFHFLHTPDGTAEGSVLESVKSPLESRVWYKYTSQADSYHMGTTSQPTVVARVMSDGTTQAYQYAYNTLGKVTQTIDPVGRTFTYDYDTTNNVDLLDVRQTQGSNNDALMKMTYNTVHRPLTVVDASGQSTSLQYNTKGQLTQVTNPKSEITTYTYTGPSGSGTGNYLTSIVGPAPSGVTGDSVSCTYDVMGRLSTVTDSQGYVLMYGYDNLDRLTSITYPDGTFEVFAYANLDMVWHKDRLNRWTHNVYDANEQLTSTTDPQGRTTALSWCKCGALASLIDPNGNTTSWIRDVESRVISKVYSDGTKNQYVYDPSTSRLQSFVDPKGQVTGYTYNQDDSIKQVTYSRTNHPTPNVNFSYDTNYRRLTSMVDGTGTTNYTYNPYSTFSGSWPTSASTGVGRLATEAGPLLNATIAYSYDQLGRVLSRTINGAANSAAVTYDNLDRVGTITNNLGSFTNTYVSTTSRLSTMSFPNGLNLTQSYFPNTGDQRLQEIKYTKSSSAVVSKQDYTYNSVGDITTWTRQADASTPTVYNYTYDGADQMTEALLTQSGATVHRHVENYDAAGNRTSEQIDLNVTSSSYNNLNQLTSQSGGGPLRLSGTVNQPSSVTVNGNAATTSSTVSSTNFTTQASAVTGTNIFTVVAQNQSGYSTTNRFQVVVPSAGSGNTRNYDPSGNLLSDGTKTYEWDAVNRLTAINNGPLRSEFTYDGMSRRVKIVEKSSGTVTSTKQFVWVGSTIAEERDASNTVIKRFYGQGEQISGTNYYYTRDHLGSVREMTNSSGTIVARYDYDPYGRVTLISGSNLSDKQYAGMYLHLPSGLNFTLFRAYDCNTAKWLSRDPIGEAGGINIYGYVGNDPLNEIDPKGDIFFAPAVVAVIALVVVVSTVAFLLNEVIPDRQPDPIPVPPPTPVPPKPYDPSTPLIPPYNPFAPPPPISPFCPIGPNTPILVTPKTPPSDPNQQQIGPIKPNTYPDPESDPESPKQPDGPEPDSEVEVHTRVPAHVLYEIDYE